MNKHEKCIISGKTVLTGDSKGIKAEVVNHPRDGWSLKVETVLGPPYGCLFPIKGGICPACGEILEQSKEPIQVEEQQTPPAEPRVISSLADDARYDGAFN
jgi:hypothetical protein